MSDAASSVIFSKPVYSDASSPPTGARRRLVVAQDARLSEVAHLVRALQAETAPIELLSLYGGLAAQIGQRSFNDPDRLKAGLLGALAAEAVGTRLYVCGDESFLWRIRGIAVRAGLQDDELELIRVGSRRQLYCVHCSTLQEISDETEIVCAKCRVRLMVREHFSRRLGAYMGVCIDPDHPHVEART